MMDERALQLGVGNKVLACAKHFVGDGGTTKDINENNTVIDRPGLLSIHMPAYYNSIIKGVNHHGLLLKLDWKKMYSNHNLFTRFLKDTLNFRDYLTTPFNYAYSVLAGIQAGIDMVMVPLNHTEFINDLTYLVKNKFIPMSRIDDDVRRILRVKFTMGLPFG
ncbi:hypothetical protein HHK36_018061 [Tetracentron sinense]|uniref:Glycoside hydrolase family 3 N-terminal domain-containing protein n=1 Tax=Tetracentron sinense TaxID=13715 RepID=A0A834Z3X6_TETSI|nr:hypothetical protein HHK36_018061 [Tetracentron sinense]